MDRGYGSSAKIGQRKHFSVEGLFECNIPSISSDCSSIDIATKWIFVYFLCCTLQLFGEL